MSWGVFSYFRTAGILSASALLFLNSAQAGEKIHFSDSPEKVDVPKPTTRDDRISARFGTSKTEGADVGPPVSMTPSAGRPAPNPLMSQKLEEYLDKKRNWMFVDPKDKDKLGEENSFKTEEISLDSEKKKTVQEQFYEHPSEKPTARKKKDSDADSDNGDNNRESDRDRKPEAEPSGLTPELSLGSLLRPPGGMESGMRSLNELSRATSMGSFTPEPSEAIRKADHERDMKQHDSEFARIIAPRSGAPSFSAGGDPVNTQNDITRQEINPFAPRTGFGSYNNAGASAEGVQSFAPPANLPRQGGTESFASQIPAAPIFSASSPFSSTPVRSFQNDRKPIFFEPPHRKF